MTGWVIYFLGAFLLTLAGVAIIYAAWKGRERSVARLGAGWSCVAAGFPLWSRSAGVDVGPAIGVVVLTFVALVFVLANGQWSTRSNGTRIRRARSEAPISPLDASPSTDPHRIRLTIMRVIAGGPLAFAASCAAALLTVAYFDTPEADRIVIAACLMLFLWSVSLVWVCATRKWMQPVTTLALVAGASVMLLRLGS